MTQVLLSVAKVAASAKVGNIGVINIQAMASFINLANFLTCSFR
jgi:hypothetical protein